MDTRVKPAYDDLDAWAVSYNARTGLQRRAAQEIFRFHRLLAGALQFENPDRAFLAGDREMVVARVEVQWTIQEIAHRFGMASIDAARVAVSRSLKRLTAQLSARGTV